MRGSSFRPPPRNECCGILTANTRGILRLHKLLREGLGRDSVLFIEGSGDVAGRWADLSFASQPTAAFTLPLPFKLSVQTMGVRVFMPDPRFSEDINVALAHGYVLQVNLGEGKTFPDPAPLRRHVRMRERLDMAAAPGYPQGFRDSVGVQTSTDALVVKAFTAPEGMTVVYYATASVRSARVTVDGAALGHPQLGTRTYSVTVDEEDIDFQVSRP